MSQNELVLSFYRVSLHRLLGMTLISLFGSNSPGSHRSTNNNCCNGGNNNSSNNNCCSGGNNNSNNHSNCGSGNELFIQQLINSVGRKGSVNVATKCVQYFNRKKVSQYSNSVRWAAMGPRIGRAPS